MADTSSCIGGVTPNEEAALDVGVLGQHDRLTTQPVAGLDPRSRTIYSRSKQIFRASATQGFVYYYSWLVAGKEPPHGRLAPPNPHNHIANRDFKKRYCMWRNHLHKYDDSPCLEGLARIVQDPKVMYEARRAEAAKSGRQTHSPMPSGEGQNAVLEQLGDGLQLSVADIIEILHGHQTAVQLAELLGGLSGMLNETATVPFHMGELAGRTLQGSDVPMPTQFRCGEVVQVAVDSALTQWVDCSIIRCTGNLYDIHVHPTTLYDNAAGHAGRAVAGVSPAMLRCTEVLHVAHQCSAWQAALSASSAVVAALCTVVSSLDPLLDVLLPGVKVVLKGLVRNPELNGLQGTLRHLQGDRWVVALPAPHGQRAVCVKSILRLPTSPHTPTRRVRRRLRSPHPVTPQKRRKARLLCGVGTGDSIELGAMAREFVALQDAKDNALLEEKYAEAQGIQEDIADVLENMEVVESKCKAEARRRRRQQVEMARKYNAMIREMRGEAEATDCAISSKLAEIEEIQLMKALAVVHDERVEADNKEKEGDMRDILSTGLDKAYKAMERVNALRDSWRAAAPPVVSSAIAAAELRCQSLQARMELLELQERIAVQQRDVDERHCASQAQLAGTTEMDEESDDEQEAPSMLEKCIWLQHLESLKHTAIADGNFAQADKLKGEIQGVREAIGSLCTATP